MPRGKKAAAAPADPNQNAEDAEAKKKNQIKEEDEFNTRPRSRKRRLQLWAAQMFRELAPKRAIRSRNSINAFWSTDEGHALGDRVIRATKSGSLSDEDIWKVRTVAEGGVSMASTPGKGGNSTRPASKKKTPESKTKATGNAGRGRSRSSRTA